MTATSVHPAHRTGGWTRVGLGAVVAAALLAVRGAPAPLLLSFGLLGGVSVSGAV
jgi:hypothetical protein